MPPPTISTDVRSIVGRYDVGVALPSSKIKGSSLTDDDDVVIDCSGCLVNIVVFVFLDGGPKPPPGEERTRPWSMPPRAWLDAEGRFLP